MRQIYADLGRNLALLRDEKGYTQSQLARALRIPQSTYAGYEICLRKMPVDVLKQIADFFHVSVDYLLREEAEGE
ncbi:MAG: helix-turn-helix domain-containing protein [Clostridiales bacterium]|jgi:transcriptional regulator with XRE-family HTH domain|nr:helix-turn-helix domain-containing protein [Clostridiales bacterium]